MITINSTLIAQILNFLILVFILKKLDYKPVVRMLKARQDRIQESLDKADAEAAEADKTLAEYKEQLASARIKAQEIIDNANKRAQQEREDSIQQTKHEIERMRTAAKAEIARDRERAQEQIKSEIVTLSLLAASKVIGAQIDEKSNEKIVTDFVEKLDKDKIGDLTC